MFSLIVWVTFLLRNLVAWDALLVLCLSGQKMVPTGQRPLLKDSSRQNSKLWEEQLADPTIAYITPVNVVLTSK